MNWRFCPHCETQLDDATGICPACRWDPLDVPPPSAAAEPEVSLMERYRGTEYDNMQVVAPAVAERSTNGPPARFKIVMIAAILALVGLYGGMLAWTEIKDSIDRPAMPALTTTR